VLGVGLGNSVQKHVLPAPHTDSILAVIGEEWGLLGTVTVLFLFMVVAYRGMRIAVSAPDNFARLVASGVTCWITVQALLNFAVITSSVPFTGVPLPFISYGGTSLVITMAALGIVLNISRHTSGEGFARHSTRHGRRNRRPRLSGARDHTSTPAGEDRRPAVKVVAPKSSGRSQARNPG
jgi:cell division protein FtsW